MMSLMTAPMRAFRPTEEDLKRLLPTEEDADIRLNSSVVDAGLQFYFAQGFAQGYHGVEATIWRSIPKTLEKAMQCAASNCTKIANGIHDSYMAHSAAPYGVTIAHIGPPTNGHTVCVLYSWTARTIGIYDSLYGRTTAQDFHMQLRSDYKKLVPVGTSGEMPPGYDRLAYRIIMWLTVEDSAFTNPFQTNGKDSVEFAIKASMESSRKKFVEWRVSVMGTKGKQDADDCGAMALATARALLCVEADMRVRSIMSPVFYLMATDGSRNPDPKRKYSAQALARLPRHKWDLCGEARTFMCLPPSTVTPDTADYVRASLSLTLEKSPCGGEDVVDFHYPLYTLRTAIEEIVMMHSLQVHLEGVTTCAFHAVIVTSRSMRAIAEELGDCLSARLCTQKWDGPVYVVTDRDDLTTNDRNAIKNAHFIACLTDVDWDDEDDRIESDGRLGSEFLEREECGNCVTVVNAVLFRNVPRDDMRDLIPGIVQAPRDDCHRFWAISMSSSRSHVLSRRVSSDESTRKRTFLANGHRIRALKDECNFERLFDKDIVIDVDRPGDTLRVRYCSLGSLEMN